jgi:hypothetical protein
MILFDKLFFDNPVGLGDAFVMNAIVHHYARMSGTLYYPAKGEFYETLKCLYKDHPNIEVWRFYGADQVDVFLQTNPGLTRLTSMPLVTSEIHRMGCAVEYIQVHWPQQIYENFDIPFKMRYLDFQMPKDIPGSKELYEQLVGDATDYVVFHRYASDHPKGIPLNLKAFRESRGLLDKKIIEIEAGQTTNMLQYKMLIENASEIHCIPSSFFNLVDSMDVKGQLWFHDIRKNSLMKVNSRWNSSKWNIVNYSVRY